MLVFVIAYQAIRIRILKRKLKSAEARQTVLHRLVQNHARSYKKQAAVIKSALNRLNTRLSSFVVFPDNIWEHKNVRYH